MMPPAKRIIVGNCKQWCQVCNLEHIEVVCVVLLVILSVISNKEGVCETFVSLSFARPC